MPLIECTVGYASTPVRGTYYNFERDRHGRYVCMVYDDKDAEVFLSGAVPYRLAENLDIVSTALTPAVPDDPTTPPAAPKAPDQPGPDLQQLLAQAVPPLLDQRGEAIYVLAPWPALVPVSDGLLKTEQPWFTAGEGHMFITVANGTATYQIKGTVDDTHIYALLEGSTFTEPPADPNALSSALTADGEATETTGATETTDAAAAAAADGGAGGGEGAATPTTPPAAPKAPRAKKTAAKAAAQGE